MKVVSCAVPGSAVCFGDHIWFGTEDSFFLLKEGIGLQGESQMA